MDRVQLSPNLIYSAGTQVVTLRDITDAVGLGELAPDGNCQTLAAQLDRLGVGTVET